MSASDPASKAQCDYLIRLATKHAIYGPDLTLEQTVAVARVFTTSSLTKAAASTLIDDAHRSPRWPEAVRPASPYSVTRIRYMAGSLALFGLAFTPEETVDRVITETQPPVSADTVNALFRLANDAKPHPTYKTALLLSLIENVDGLDISEGHFAAPFEGVLRFYRVYEPTTGENAGQAVIRRFGGETLHGLYPNEAETVLRHISANPDAAAFRFSDEYTRCFLCGRVLTDAVSRLMSVGPTCRGFTVHHGLRTAANAVDNDSTRKATYRAIHAHYRTTNIKNTQATLIASAWSGLPGFLDHTPDQAVALVTDSLAGNVPDSVREALLGAAPDTALLLVASGALSAPVMNILYAHPSPKVQKAVGEFFLRALTGG